MAVQANRSKGTATVVVRYQEDTAGKAGWYREGIARTSRPPASSSRTDAPKFFVLAGARAPAHEIGANTNLKINKDCSKNYYFFVHRFIRVLLLLDKWMAIARRAWGVWSNFCQDGKWLEGFGLDQRKQLSIVVGMQNLVQTFDMVDNGTNQKQNCSQGMGSHVETIGFDSIGQHVKKGKRGACRQKASTVLPNRTAAA